jgi:plastocyanin
MAFDTKQISVTAGTAVTVIFNNKDTGIPHNFAVYQKLSGGQTKAVFIGNTITGTATVTYNFIAPVAGNTYFFECDVHPTVMNGTFTVTP